jgi:hypothetical protein
MNRPRLTAAAAALLRALMNRAGGDRDRIVLSEWITVDWHSLTYSGERHRAGLLFNGADAPAWAACWCDGLGEAEFDLGPAAFVASVALAGPPRTREDGSVLVEVEALTIAD